MYLSKKTLYNRSKAEKTGSSKKPCPKCNKLFIRLDNHLRNHPICKSIPSTSLPDSEQASHPPSTTRSYSSPSCKQPQLPCSPNPSCICSRSCLAAPVAMQPQLYAAAQATMHPQLYAAAPAVCNLKQQNSQNQN